MQARVDTHLRAGTTRAYASRKSSRQISTSSKVLARSRHATDGARVGGVRALLGSMTGEEDCGMRLGVSASPWAWEMPAWGRGGQ